MFYSANRLKKIKS